jgi:putative molybdopterin biosynthesis protein
MSEYLTTTEVAELLRIKKRKVYDLAASGAIPCSRAMGKLLFPAEAVKAWIAQNSSGGGRIDPVHRPNVLLGSHDPLLDWAVRESRSGLASFFDGSFDGLARYGRGEGVAAGLHLHDAATGAWNVPAVRGRLGNDPAVLVEWAWRQRGIIVDPGKAGKIEGLRDLTGLRVVPRQAEAGTQALFQQLIENEGIDAGGMSFLAPARNETDAALAVLEGKADAAFGLKSLAAQYRLGFVPIVDERFDLLVDRRAWFEPPMQTLLAFCRSPVFEAKLHDLEGYDVSGLGRVHYNGP